MARPREFNIDEVLEQAMQMFWSKGYEATSMHDLTGTMGLSKSSLYDTFGNKHELFLSAVGRYNETVAGRVVATAIAEAGGAKAGIVAVFERRIDDMVEGGGARGCLLNNTAVEMGARDRACAAQVAAGLALTEDAFHLAVRDGQEMDEIPAHRDARVLARYLTSSLNGLTVMAKADPDRAALEDVVGVVLRALD